MRDRILLAGCFGFVGGILVRSFLNVGWAGGGACALFALAIFCVGMLATSRPSLETKQNWGGALTLVAVFLFSLGLGIARYELSEYRTRDVGLDARLGHTVSLGGVVSDEPDERANSARLTVVADALRENGRTVPLNAKVLVVGALYPKFHYGDRVEVFGLLAKPKNFADPNGKIFDYQSYLAVSGIYYEVPRPTIKVLASDQGNFIVSKLFALKQAFLKNVNALIPEPHAGLLGGLVVGAKRALGKNLLEDFRHAGVIHIVVLSGYNITIVADAIMRFFGFLPRAFGQSLGALGIVFFAIMAGGSATVIRASIMALLVILARATGRPYDILRALLLAGFLMVLQNPKILVFDSSFQLSFMSTLALIFVSPLLEKYFLWVTEKWGLRSVVIATLATQIFVLPMLLYKMGELSLVALPVNLLILFAIPATMLFGFLAGSIGFFSLALAFPFAFVAYALLAYELRVVEFFSHLPFASVAVSNFPLWFAVLWYALYLVLFFRFRPKPSLARN